MHGVEVPNKETVDEFLKNIKTWPDIIQKNALKIWNEETLIALGQSVYVAPRKTGQLQSQVGTIKAKLTPNGITSAYVFSAVSDGGYSYPKKVNEMENKQIKKTINPNARSHFAEYGVGKVEKPLMDRLADLIGRTFIQI